MFHKNFKILTNQTFSDQIKIFRKRKTDGPITLLPERTIHERGLWKRIMPVNTTVAGVLIKIRVARMRARRTARVTPRDTVGNIFPDGGSLLAGLHGTVPV